MTCCLIMIVSQVPGYVTAEGGGSERGDGASLPGINSPGVDRRAHQPCNGPSAENNRRY